MPRVLKLEASRHVRGRVLVFFEGAELVKVTEEEVLLHHLYAGKELTGAEYTALTAAARLASAKTAAARICSTKLLSRGELLQRLAEKGEDPACGEQAADRLEELGVLDDARYAAAVARHYAGRGYGRRKIEQELYRRRVPRALWPAALDGLEDSSETIDRLVAQKLRGREPEPKELGRVQSFLLRRGFSWEQVREALERYRAEGTEDGW